MISIYCSLHGHTTQVVEKFGLPALNVATLKDWPSVTHHKAFVFFCPTYGDAELPEPMESFFRWFWLKNKKYIICELGNYYGYDDLTFGAAKIIRHHMDILGWEEIGPTLSLDSLPTIDWPAFDKWKEMAHAALRRCEGC